MSDKPAKISSVDLLTKDQAALVDDIKHHHDAFHRTYEQQMEHAVICGVRLLQLKDSVPHGNKNGDSPGFTAIREKHLPNLSSSAACRYMDFVRLLQPQISHGGDFRNTLQLTEGDSRLAETQRKQVLKAVHDLADGKTFTAFYRDLGLVKHREKGGFHPPTDDLIAWLQEHHTHVLTDHKTPYPLKKHITFDWLKEHYPAIAAAFKKQWKPKPIPAELALQAKRDRSRKLREQLDQWIDDKEFAHDTVEDARLWKESLYDAYKAVSARLKGTGKRKGRAK